MPAGCGEQTSRQQDDAEHGGSVFAGKIRNAPDATEADGRANRGKVRIVTISGAVWPATQPRRRLSP
jgi:hypothetical protein